MTRPLPSIPMRPPWAHLQILAVAALFATAIAAGAAQEKAAAPAAAPPADSKPAEYVGSTTCQTCHEDIFNAFQKNPHQAVETNKPKPASRATDRAASTPNRRPRPISGSPPN